MIEAIAQAIASTDGVNLLDVDPGLSTNRTVYTFVGAPEQVVEGALNGARAASQLLDMTRHTGQFPIHPYAANTVYNYFSHSSSIYLLENAYKQINFTGMAKIVCGRCLVNLKIKFLRRLFLHKCIFFFHFELEIALAITAENEWKIVQNNSVASGSSTKL